VFNLFTKDKFGIVCKIKIKEGALFPSKWNGGMWAKVFEEPLMKILYQKF